VLYSVGRADGPATSTSGCSVIFVSLMTLKPHLSRPQIDDAAQRRARWKYPEGITLIAEYWLQGTPQIVSIVEAQAIGPVMQATYPWADVYDIQTHPALSAEDGLRVLQQAGVIRRRGRRPRALVEAMRARGEVP